MAPVATVGARMVVHHFRAKKAQIIEESPLAGQMLPPGWVCS